METYSPTGSRLSQRLLLSTSVIYGWEVVSMDIGTAFLQGRPLEEADRVGGQSRAGSMRPPQDCWDYLPKGFPKLDEALKSKASYLWELIKAVYGLKDAPRLWAAALTAWLLGLGFVQSRHDKMVFFLRKCSKTGRWSTRGSPLLKGVLIAMVVGHVDDLGVGSTPQVYNWLHAEAEKQFGKTRLEKGTFVHVGLQYRNLPNFEKSADLEEFIREIPFAEEPRAT